MMARQYYVVNLIMACDGSPFHHRIRECGSCSIPFSCSSRTSRDRSWRDVVKCIKTLQLGAKYQLSKTTARFVLPSQTLLRFWTAVQRRTHRTTLVPLPYDFYTTSSRGSHIAIWDLRRAEPTLLSYWADYWLSKWLSCLQFSGWWSSDPSPKLLLNSEV